MEAFHDSSKASLKAVLLHNGNKFPSAPLTRAVHTKETYANLQVLLQKIRYEEHRWNIFADKSCGNADGKAKWIH
jgi:hypothetical protein